MSKHILNNKQNLVVGYCGLAISLVLFILSLINSLAITSFFQGLFGIMWYVMLIVLFLFSCAKIMNLHYSYSKKFTTFALLFMFSFIVLLHVIFSTSALAGCSFGEYLAASYYKTYGITVGGAALSVVVRCLYSCVWMVGSYCIPILCMTIFGGLVLDAIIYGNTKKKTHEAKVAAQNFADHIEADILQPREEENIANEEPADFVDKPQEKPSTISPIYNEKIINQPRQEAYSGNLRERDPNYRSARDILFGKQDVPDVTLPNDKERDMWMRNYREQNSVAAEQADEDINELFGGNLDSASASQVGPRGGRSEIYKRNFPDRPVNINNNFSFDEPQDDDNQSSSLISSDIDDDMDSDINLPFDDDADDQITPIVSRTSRLERPMRGAISSQKIGENEVDQTRGSKKLDVKSKSYSGKQIGIKSVRYNSIPLSVFKVYAENNTDYSEEYRRKSAALEKVMSDFNIGAKVINVVRGPKVTRYELTLPDGVSVSRVLSIETDISMSIEAKSKIRIEAPIPGKKAFGIELENDEPSTVGMRELLESPEFINCKDPLPIAIGKDINGHVIIKSLPKMIHLLVAGSSGSGKSIFIHSLMMSILYKYSPDDVRFIMIDPKRVEFSMYNHLPHLMLPNVVSDHDKALNAIKWAVAEMDRRYVALQEHECQNLEQYNKLPEVTSGQESKMPYLIIVVDELAELMGGSLKKDFEAGIQRITQLGRAAGIHMVVATQRPSVDVVTGTIKNNMPTRVAFALASSADSKTVLDEGGAENLLGKGDMLFAPQDMNRKIRLQAAFCDNDEIRNAIKYVKENNEATYDETAVNAINAEKPAESANGQEGTNTAPDNGSDEYLKLAAQFAMSTGKVSVSLLQRKFRIGFNRASRIMDELVELGAVGPSIGAKPRDFIMSEEQYRELFGDDEE